MKVRILNGSHTSLVFPSLLCDVETVGESVKDELLRSYLDKCLSDYILPMLGETQENKDFAAAVLERFANPYIRHLWKSISLNSVSKFKARVMPTINDYIEKTGDAPKTLLFALGCLIEYYKNNEVSDDKAAAELIRNSDIVTILAQENLWGASLEKYADIVTEAIEKIHTDTIREAVKWAMS